MDWNEIDFENFTKEQLIFFLKKVLTELDNIEQRVKSLEADLMKRGIYFPDNYQAPPRDPDNEN